MSQRWTALFSRGFVPAAKFPQRADGPTFGVSGGGPGSSVIRSAILSRQAERRGHRQLDIKPKCPIYMHIFQKSKIVCGCFFPDRLHVTMLDADYDASNAAKRYLVWDGNVLKFADWWKFPERCFYEIAGTLSFRLSETSVGKTSRIHMYNGWSWVCAFYWASYHQTSGMYCGPSP
ncbi:hypothetical protein [Ruegeria sp. HKCCD7559]|uniref:hypothetical protein n=1 Tax=Ruegeria sp. HKCCD7559 TaxID=2683005 RepID=UPI00149215B6|nr:hypothetical protein [Ruegeria sp. HKCCD7559]NOC44525.1 hypothetical protein [Ruegeria sp. HKCCD7559]